jgi:hypothetical protein
MLGSLVVSAHHAVAGYERDKVLTLKGTVTEWRWRNPHCFLVWTVKDSNGNSVEWTGEMASPMTMQSLGLTRTTFKPGDEVTLEVYPAMKGTPQSILRRVTKDGKVLMDQNPLAGNRQGGDR